MLPIDAPKNAPGTPGDGVSLDLDFIDRKLAALEYRLAAGKSEPGNSEIRPLLDRLAQPVIVHARDRVIYANEPAARLFDVAAPELLTAKPVLTLIDDSCRATVADRLSAKRGDQEADDLSTRCVSTGGHVFEASIAMTGIVWSGRSATLWLLDMTESEPAHNRTESDPIKVPADTLEDGLWDWNLQSGGVFIGPRFRSMLDYAPGEREGRIGGWSELVHPDDLGQVDRSTQEHLTGVTPIWQADLRLRNAAGHYRWVQLRGRGVPGEGGTFGRIVGTASDIERVRSLESDIKARDDDLQRLRRLLGFRTKEVARLNRELSTTRKQAAIAGRVKAQFLGNMSHELRTPLNAVMGFAEVIRDEMFGPVSEPRYREYAGDILVSAKSLLQLVDDILDLSRLESGQAELKEELVDPRAAARSVLTIFRSRAEEAGLTLETRFDRDLPQLLADPHLFKQMLLNLLENAVRSTPADGVIELSVTLPDSGGVNIAVSDNGRGMTPDQMRRELTPFGQGEDWKARHDGASGLGLALTMAQIELHGGYLEIESAPGEGTWIGLNFPSGRIRPVGPPTSVATIVD